MSETVLVTGGTGFIGRWCIVELLRRGYQVRTTVRGLDKEASVRSALATVIEPGDRLTCVVADLTADDGWAEAVAGCDYVLHVASPMGLDAQSGPDAPALPAYRMSKTLAEKAAWAFMNDASGSTTLTTILPGAVFGPILAADNLGSVQVIRRMLVGAMPGTPKIGLEVVDVRDLVDVRLMARSRPELRSIMPGLGRRNRHTTAKAERVLGWKRRPVADTIVDCARSLIDHGTVVSRQ